jgi:hypothetical protein
MAIAPSICRSFTKLRLKVADGELRHSFVFRGICEHQTLSSLCDCARLVWALGNQMSDQAEAFADNRIRVTETHHRTHHLVELLVSYVSEADADLPRDQFLRLVINRIVDELCSPLPRPR